MNNGIVTTNLRLPRQDWLMIKSLASEEGKSFNEYVNLLIKNMSKQKIVFGGMTKTKVSKKISLKDLRKMVAETEGKKMGLNREDEVIYD